MSHRNLKIVVIDGYTINPGDLSWKRLEAYGDVAVYPQSSVEEAKDRLEDADIAFVNKVVFNREFIDTLPRLRFISLTATGYNNLDIAYLKEKGILVSNVKGYGDHAVAQHTISLLLELSNRVGHYNLKSRDGAWSNSGNFCFYDEPLTELYGLKMGIIGWGNIGSKVGAIARALGMEVLFYSRIKKQTEIARQVETADDIFRECDVVSLHCLLAPETSLMVNERTLGLMRDNAILLNTSRGGLIDEQALYNALVNGQIAGAGLDVLTVEPPKEDHLLFSAPNCIITPHNAWASATVRQRLMDMAINNLQAFLESHPANLVG